MPAITQARLAAVNRGFTVLFESALNGASTVTDRLAMNTTSQSAEEVYAWLGAFPGLKELVGEIPINDIAHSDYAIRNQTFADIVSVKRADLERAGGEGLYGPRFQMLGEAAAYHRDELTAGLVVNAFTAKDYTGAAYFAANKKHEPLATNKGKSPTFSNLTNAPLDPASYQAGRLNLLGRTNSEGRPMRLGTRGKLTLVVGSATLAAAEDLVLVETLPAGGKNKHFGTAEIVYLPEIDGSAKPAAWFLFECNLAIKPFIWQDEVKPEFASQTDPSTEAVFRRDSYMYRAYARRGAGYGFPQLAYGSTADA